jgi:hypothetical protein
MLCLFASADTHLIADVNGYFGPSTNFHSVVPLRVFDTRVGESGGATVAKQWFGRDRVLFVTISGVAGVPANDVGSVSLNVTATRPVAPGFVTVFPCGERPLASNLNFVAGETVAGAVLTSVFVEHDPGQDVLLVCFYASADVDLVADINGWFPA